MKLKQLTAETQSLKDLRQIPGVGKTIAADLLNLGITSVKSLKGQNAEILYDRHSKFKGSVQDRCMLYVFRCAVYYADTDAHLREPEKLKWWHWQDEKATVNH